jgi:hypothetical protein
MRMSQKLAALTTTAAIAAVPTAGAVAASTPTPALQKAAKAHCKALLKKEGTKKFDAKYGHKNPMGKCVSAYEKAHSKKKK